MITISGLIGGVVNYFMIADNSRKLIMRKKEGQYAPSMRFVFLRCIVVGLGASILVPLFLQMISSNLVQDVLKSKVDKIFVFVGFCVVASIFSRRFIISIGEKLLKELEDTKQTAEEANLKAIEAKQIAEESDNKADAVVDAVGEVESKEDVVLQDGVELSNEISKKQLIPSQTISEINRKVLRALLLKPNVTFRSITGISKDTELGSSIIKHILNDLIDSGLVRKLVRADGSDLYSITLKGRVLIRQQEIKTDNL